MRTIKQEHYFPIIIGIHFLFWWIDLSLYQGSFKEIHSDTLMFGEMKDINWGNHRVLGEVFSSWVVTVFAVNFLMATRARWVEKIFGGLDKMYMIHRRSGVIAVVLLILHFVVVPRDLTAFTIGKPLGFYALFLILIGVVLSAAPPLKRKIPYHKWIKFHKLMGIFYILGVVHGVMVKSLIQELPITRVYVFGMALIGIIAWFYRAFLYNIFNNKLDYKVSAVKQFDNDVVEVELAPEAKHLEFEAGQFTFVSFDGINRNEAHPFTISSHPMDKNLRLTIKSLGDYTADIQSAIKKGLRAKVQGTFGLFNFKTAKYKDQIWLAGGIGITPFLSFLREVDSTVKVDLVWSITNEEHANYKEEIEKITAIKPNVNFILWNSETKGRFQIEKQFNIKSLEAHSIFICGPEVMRESYIKQLLEKGVSIRDIHYEEFSFR